MACGYYHTLILSATGNDVLACGLNRNGQLGIGSLGTQTKKNLIKKITRFTGTKVQILTQLGIGSVDNADMFVPVDIPPGMHSIVAISAGTVSVVN